MLDRIEGVDDWKAAEAAVSEGIEITNRGMGNPVDARCLLGIILVRQGRIGEAHQILEKAYLKASTPPIVWQAQALLGLERDLASAEERWGEALTAAEVRLQRLRSARCTLPLGFFAGRMG